jgi:hypothetical protein
MNALSLIGILAVAMIGVLVLAAIVVAIRELPGIRRYWRIRHM